MNSVKNMLYHSLMRSFTDNTSPSERLFVALAGARPREKLVRAVRVLAENPVRIEAPQHPFINGEEVVARNFSSVPEFNGISGLVRNATPGFFELEGVDGTQFINDGTGGEIVLRREPLAGDNGVIQEMYNPFFAKAIDKPNIRGVIPRIDWIEKGVYERAGASEKNARDYVVNSLNQVYRCVDNANGAVSTTEPIGETSLFLRTADGYIWKYLYTILDTDADIFFTHDLMPVYSVSTNNESAQYSAQQDALDGRVETTKMISLGSGYVSAGDLTVEVEGDGVGALVEVTQSAVFEGKVTRLRVTNHGTGYTWARIVIRDVSKRGSGAYAEAILSPPGGYGLDAVYELGVKDIMLATNIIGEEAPTDISYRQIQIIRGIKKGDKWTLEETLDLTTKIDLETMNGSVIPGLSIKGGTTGATATVIAIDDLTLSVIDVAGRFLPGETVTTDGFSGVVGNISSCNYVIDPRRIIYSMDVNPRYRTSTHVDSIRTIIEV